MGNVKLLKDYNFWKEGKVIYVDGWLEKELLADKSAIKVAGQTSAQREVKTIMDNDGKTPETRKKKTTTKSNN